VRDSLCHALCFADEYLDCHSPAAIAASSPAAGNVEEKRSAAAPARPASTSVSVSATAQSSNTQHSNSALSAQALGVMQHTLQSWAQLWQQHCVLVLGPATALDLWGLLFLDPFVRRLQSHVKSHHESVCRELEAGVKALIADKKQLHKSGGEDSKEEGGGEAVADQPSKLSRTPSAASASRHHTFASSASHTASAHTFHALISELNRVMTRVEAQFHSLHTQLSTLLHPTTSAAEASSPTSALSFSTLCSVSPLPASVCRSVERVLCPALPHALSSCVRPVLDGWRQALRAWSSQLLEEGADEPDTAAAGRDEQSSESERAEGRAGGRRCVDHAVLIGRACKRLLSARAFQQLLAFYASSAPAPAPNSAAPSAAAASSGVAYIERELKETAAFAFRIW
jgi:hypothetical protein